MTQPQIKTEARINAYEGMSVAEIKKNGSTGQKIAVTLFDKNRNGVLDKGEVEAFNRCNFKSEKNKLTIFDRENERTMEIKYNNLDELYDMYEGKALNSLNYFSWGKYQKDGEEYTKHYFGKVADYEKISIDMPNAKVSVKGADGHLYSRNIDLTVSDSDCDEISTSGGSLELKNVKDEGLLWDSATKVKTDGKTVVRQDTDTKAEVMKK